MRIQLLRLKVLKENRQKATTWTVTTRVWEHSTIKTALTSKATTHAQKVVINLQRED